MADPVVHFEISGVDPQRLRAYYAELFGWQFEAPSTVAPEVSAPHSYHFLELVTGPDGTGVRGGVCGGAGYESKAIFYVGVADVAAAVRRAEALGGQCVLGPVTSPSGLVVAHVADPEGTVTGLAGG